MLLLNSEFSLFSGDTPQLPSCKSCDLRSSALLAWWDGSSISLIQDKISVSLFCCTVALNKHIYQPSFEKWEGKWCIACHTCLDVRGIICCYSWHVHLIFHSNILLSIRFIDLFIYLFIISLIYSLSFISWIH